MKKILLLISIFSLLEPVICQAREQKNADSLFSVLETAKHDSLKINTLNKLAFLFRNNNPDTAIYFADKALALAKKTDSKSGIITAYLHKATATKNLGDFEEALRINTEALSMCNLLLDTEKGNNKTKILLLKAGALSSIGSIKEETGNYTEALKCNFEALKIRNETGDITGLASTYNNLGNVYADLGNYPEALKYLFEALKIKEKTGDKKSIANSYNNIGSTFYNQGEYSQALHYHLTALKIRKENGDKAGIAGSSNNIGIIYDMQGNYGEALKCHFEALKITEEIGDRQGVALAYDNIGIVYMHQRLYNKSLPYFLNYLKISEEIEDYSGIADAHINIGNTYVKLKNYAEGNYHLNKALTLSKEIGSLDFLKYCYEGLSKLDSAQGNFKQALEHYKLFIASRDSIFNKENTKKLVQSQMQYEFDKKESLAKAEQEKKDIQSQREKNLQYFAIAMLGILVFSVVIIAFIQWRNNKQKQAANNLLANQKAELENTIMQLKSTQSQLIQSEKMASLGELTAGIAHEIQNPLNFVNNFSEVSIELLGEMNEEINKGNTEDAKQLAHDLILNLEKINHHGKRADAIVKAMLQHTRSSSGQKELTDINALADEYMRLSYHGLRAKDKSFNAILKTDFDETIGKIEIIPQDIGRVILNLITNAFYAVNEKKKLSGPEYEPIVTVTTRKTNNQVELLVTDNGNGIPQKIVEKIFQPFFTTKPTGEGTGLGLSLSYDIIKAHGGELKVESGVGSDAAKPAFTNFKITLPY